jgi:hypothetical protein
MRDASTHVMAPSPAENIPEPPATAEPVADWPPWLEPSIFWSCLLAVLICLFFKLGSIPAGLFWDETIIGYDARSIIRTGADHFGVPFPLFFESFPGDWKSPIYIYITSFNELVLGPTELAVRLTSVELVLTIALSLFFVLRSVTNNQRVARWLALATLLIPTIYFYARVATAEQLALAATTALGLNALLHFERHPSRRSASLAAFVLGLSAYSYHVGRLLGPLMIVAAAITYYPDARTRRFLPSFLLTGLATGAPMAIFMWRHPGALTNRFTTAVGLWRDNPTPWVAGQRILGTYFQHLCSVDFLFRTGQHQRNINSGLGILSVWLWLPIVLGLVTLWERRRQSAFNRYLLVMLLLSPLPVALTTENLPHTARIFHIIVFEIPIVGVAVTEWIATARPSRLLVTAALSAILLEGGQNIWYYFDDYARVVRRERPFGDDNIGDALKLVKEIRQDDEPVYVPSDFFKVYGTYLQFYLDLDPTRLRNVGFSGLNIYDAADPITRDGGGLYVGLRGGGVPPVPAELLATTPHVKAGGPAWQVYRLSRLPSLPEQGL